MAVTGVCVCVCVCVCGGDIGQTDWLVVQCCDLLALSFKATDSTKGVCSELKYAVQRLVKGLGSNRKGARHGFYTALTQVK